jgi:hypothetical protein
MAKAGKKASTPFPPPDKVALPPGSVSPWVSLAALFKQLDSPWGTYNKTLRELTALLCSGVDIHPPLTPEYWLELTRAGELRLVLVDGTVRDADKIFVRKRYENPFAPAVLSPAQMAGLAVVKPKTKPSGPVPTAKEAARLGPKQWVIYAADRFPEQETESRTEYFERLARHMRKELPEHAWTADYIRQKIYEFGILARRQRR